jgi:hypothetical protein
VTRSASVAIALVTAACSIGPVDLDGKQCPCADGWTCNTATNTCVGGATDAPVADAPPGTPDAPPGTPDGPSPPDARVDAMPGATCLGAAGSELLFDDLPDLIGWTTSGGTWAAVASEAVQSNATTQLAYAFPAGTSSFADYRVTTEVRKILGTGSIQASLRIQPSNDGQYQCAWNPNTGAMAIQWQRTNGNFGGTLTSMTVDTSGIPGYDPLAPVTIEMQAVGTQLSCCVREVPAAMLSIADNRYDSGSPGIKTSAASAAFGTFRVNTP